MTAAMLNCLFITADQWRGDHLGLAGHPCLRTPHIDKLARDGVWLANHYCQATPCGPSRASLYTGLYAFNHRSITNGTPLDHRHQTMAQLFRRAGWDPVLFGYTDTSADPRTLPAGDPRLTTYEGLLPGFRPELLLIEDMKPWLEHLRRGGIGVESVDEAYSTPFGTPARFSADLSETAFVADRLIDWLRDAAARPKGEPWLAHVSLIKPHPPWIASEPYHGRYPRSAMPPPVRHGDIGDAAALHPWLAATLDTPFSGWAGKAFATPSGLTEQAVAELRAVYCGLIAEVDQHLGRILATLEAQGELERTLIVLTSDHGEMLGDHWMIGKSGFYPQAFHVPLIIRDPRCTATRGRRIDRPTEHVDLLPTILERLDVPVPRQCDGQSLSDFLTGNEPQSWREAVFYEHDFRDLASGLHATRLGLDEESCGIAVRLSANDAYVHFAGLPALAFDRAADASLLVDRSADPAYLPRLAAQAQAMLDWRMRKAERRLTGCNLEVADRRYAFDPL